MDSSATPQKTTAPSPDQNMNNDDLLIPMHHHPSYQDSPSSSIMDVLVSSSSTVTMTPSMPSVQSSKKKRTSQACDRCSKKKIKCDGETPCENCVKASMDCTFSRGPRRRGPRTGYMAAINQRLHQMEQLLIRNNPSSVPVPMISTNHVANSGSLHSLTVTREASVALSVDSLHPLLGQQQQETDATGPLSTLLEAPLGGESLRRHSGPPSFQAPPQHRPIADYLVDQAAPSAQPASSGTHQSSSTSFSSFSSNPDSMLNFRSDGTLGLGTIDSQSSFSGSSSSLLHLPPDVESSETIGAMDSKLTHFAQSSQQQEAQSSAFARLYMNEDMLDQTIRYRPPVQQQSESSAINAATSPNPPPIPDNSANEEPRTPPHQLTPTHSALFDSRIPLDHRLSGQISSEFSHLWRDEPDWKLLDLFFTHVYPSVALIPRQAFYQGVTEPPLLLNSMYALAAGFQQKNETGDVDRNAGLAYFQEAKRQLVTEIEIPSLSVVYALYLMSHYAMHYGQLNFASVASGLAIKQGLRLGLSNEETFDYEVHGYPGFTRPQNVEIVRRLWWLLYLADVMDRRTGDKFFLIRDEDCLTCLPSDDSAVWDSVVSEAWIEPGSAEAKIQILHLSSSAPFYNAYPISSYRGMTAQLQKIHRRITEFNFRVTDLSSDFPAHQADFEAQQLEMSLDQFKRQLQPSLKSNLDKDYLSQDLDKDQNQWSTVYCQAFLQYLYYFVYYGRCLGMDKYGIDVYANRHGIVMDTLRQNATKFTEILDKFLVDNPLFMYTSPFLSAMTFDVGLIHLMVVKLCDVPEAVEEHNRSLQKHKFALGSCSRFFAESERYALIIAKGYQIDLTPYDSRTRIGKLKADLQVLIGQQS